MQGGFASKHVTWNSGHTVDLILSLSKDEVVAPYLRSLTGCAPPTLGRDLAQSNRRTITPVEYSASRP